MAKLAKAAVDYRPASPLTWRRRCGNCSMYRSGGSCTLVAGVIVPQGVCDRYDRKGKPEPRRRGEGGREWN